MFVSGLWYIAIPKKTCSPGRCRKRSKKGWEALNTAFSDMVGNLALRERLRDDICKDRLSHAYILEGAAGSGKHMLAWRIAAALECESKGTGGTPLPCGSCPACRKILSGNSPDLITVGRGDKATLGVEAIRRMHTDVWVAPNDFSHKIYLIEDAHTMTEQAQNALLLTLEEPPAYVKFFLLCESVIPLLETIRSRAPTLRTEPIPQNLVGEHLKRTEPEADKLLRQAPEEFAELLVIADGSIGRAKALLDPKKRKPILEQRACAMEFIGLCSSHRNSAAVLSFLSGLGQKREDIIARLNMILLALRDLLLCKSAENVPLCFFAQREEAAETAYRFSSPELLRLCEALQAATDRLRMNSNVRLTLIELAMRAGLLS